MNIISIRGMSCEHCKKAVTEALEGLGLKDIEVDIKNGIATFAKCDVDMLSLRRAIGEAGFDIG